MAARSTFKANLFRRVLVDIRRTNHQRNFRIIPYRKARRASAAIISSLSYSNQICGAFFSTKATANLTSDTYVQPINIAVCVERVPLVTPSKSDLEKQFEDLQEQLELEHSSLSDYEISKAKMIKKREELKNDADNEKLKKEVAQLDSEYQELIEIEQQHIKDASLASRTTAADLSNDRGSLNRKLESTLFLLTQSQENPKKWQMPQGDLYPGETLRQAAERIVKECVDDDVSVCFMSNAPSGVYRRPQEDGAIPGSPKVFFYRAQLSRSVHKFGDKMWSNCIWASKDELTEYLPSNYYQSISRFLF